jgi:hypothetical protein
MNPVAIALNRFGLGARPADPQPAMTTLFPESRGSAFRQQLIA